MLLLNATKRWKTFSILRNLRNIAVNRGDVWCEVDDDDNGDDDFEGFRFKAL